MAYQFHSWARKSIANEITVRDHLGIGDPPADVKISVPLAVTVSGNTVDKQFIIAGPGEIIGIHTEMIVRTDPRPNSGDFEPNYFPSIEFYDEDFPWRYSPAAPNAGFDNNRLRPWLMLIVLTENEFQKTDRTTPLSTIIVTGTEALPPADEIYLWAHVHSNLGEVDSPLGDVFGNLQQKMETDPDGLFSRIICPRKLEPDVLYHAFLVPVFECGRLAGLDQPIENIPLQQAAWNDDSVEVELPVYYRWQFRTGANVDFETLVRMMEARKELDPRVGIRNLDCTDPGYIKVGEQGGIPPPVPGILGMCGAVMQLDADPTVLRAPLQDQPFIKEVGKHLRLFTPEQDNEKDPVVTIPFYGYHHAKTKTDSTPDFVPQNESWLNQTNRDPRNRSAAGLGTRVVQANQEKLMQSAWSQLSAIQQINRKVKQLKLAMEVNERLLKGTVMKMQNDNGKMLAIAATVSARIKDPANSKTIFQTLTDSQVPNAIVSPALRRLSRPNGGLSKKLKTAGTFSLATVFKTVNPDIAPVVDVNIQPVWFTSFGDFKLNKNLPTTIPDIPTMDSNITNIIVGLPGHGGGVLHTGVITAAPRRPPVDNDGGITRGGGELPRERPPVKPVDAKTKMIFDTTDQVMTIGVVETFSTTKIPAEFHATVLNGLLPENTLLPAFRAKMPGLPKPPVKKDDVLPVMAHPDFPEPAYKYVAALDQDYIIPNLDLVPPNTVALMQPNFSFIHSLLIGLNHEMGRELLWREYPTDQRGSYFRQFWDPGGLRAPNAPSSPDLYKDIRPIHLWGNDTSLENFSVIGRPSPIKPLVLLLKGELLKKYPNTIVFAQRAIKDSQNQLVLDPADTIDKYKFPVFSGNLAPDTRLLGFELTKEEVKLTGEPGESGTGWFFVLAEVPGEPRFGMDIHYEAPASGPNTWNDLSLENFTDFSFVSGSKSPNPSTSNGGWPADPNSELLEIWGRSSADMAGILFQKPVMVAMHGSELLKDF
ncbi:MAG TPA: hypothetical protein VK628_05270 [Flavitalea sp.]|nr:hypothetical protein [Flavitalea sp.]